MSTDSNRATHGRGRDGLTDALSRQRFLELLGDEKRLADSTRRPFALALFDIDALRSLNEGYGTGAGDAALLELAHRIRAALDSRPWNDVVDLHARFDGGALMVFLRGTSLEQGAQFAETVRAAVAAAVIESRLRVTVSAGVAGYRVGEPLEAMLARTEQSLYLAKQFGRDCIEIAPNPDLPASADNLIQFPGSGWHGRSKAG